MFLSAGKGPYIKDVCDLDVRGVKFFESLPMNRSKTCQHGGWRCQKIEKRSDIFYGLYLSVLVSSQKLIFNIFPLIPSHITYVNIISNRK